MTEDLFAEAEPFVAPPPEGKGEVLSVSELTSQLKRHLEPAFPSVRVQGEISNLSRPSSGHIYFTLKDGRAELRAVLYRMHAQWLEIPLENGLSVLAHGGISIYEQRGNYQLVVKRMEPAGVGALFLKLEAVKKKLAAEGLFAPGRKRPLPRYPRCVGVVTSATGAAWRDIESILGRRAPHIRIVVRPTIVQGATASRDICVAIGELNRQGEAEVLIVGRGGGSLEELWAFNEEPVVRAIAESRIPIISAVGHETDFTLSDFVADCRAATPSTAAELVSPAREEMLAAIGELQRRMATAANLAVQDGWQNLDLLTDRYGFRQPRTLLDLYRRQVEELWQRAGRRAVASTEARRLIHNGWWGRLRAVDALTPHRTQFRGWVDRLASVDPNAILQRGYSIAYDRTSGKILRRGRDTAPGKIFGVVLSKGEIVGRVEKVVGGGKPASAAHTTKSMEERKGG